MQTPKPRNGSEVHKRLSPITPKMNHPAKVPVSDSDCTSPHRNLKSPNDKNLKIERRSPRNLVPEKRRASKVSELECQIIQLQQELKKTRDQLSSTEAWKRRAQQEVEEAKKKLLVTSVKLEDSQNQLVDLSAAEETRLQELRKISHERDRAWQSELEAMQHQHSVDAAALASAMNEIQRLKMQLDMVLRSEAARAKKSEIEHSELRMTKQNLTEALLTIENLKVQLRDCEKAESEAKAMLTETKSQLGVAQHTIETLLSDGSKLMESFSIIAIELKESRSRVNSLEDIVVKVQEDRSAVCTRVLSGFPLKKIQSEPVNSEVEQLISFIEMMMLRYHEQQIESIVKLNNAYESMEKMSSDNRIRESELESRLNDAKSEVIVLKASLFDKEFELRNLLETKNKKQQELEDGQKSQMAQIQSQFELKLSQSIADVSELKSKVTDKEKTLQLILEENEQLKSELKKSHDAHHEATAEAELARAAEKDALLKLSCATKEAEENGKRAFMSAEQLDAAQAIRSEMDAELKRLKVQSDQWRKAAEAAAAVLTAGTNGRFLERTGSLDSEYKCTPTKLAASPFIDDLDDESSWKKRNNMLRRLSGMWKREQKVIQNQ